MWLLQCSISLALKTALWWAPVLFWIHFGNRSRSKFFRVSGASILMWRNHYMIWSACSGRVSYGSNPTFPFQMRVRCIIRISRNVYCRGLHFAVSQSQADFFELEHVWVYPSHVDCQHGWHCFNWIQKATCVYITYKNQLDDLLKTSQDHNVLYTQGASTSSCFLWGPTLGSDFAPEFPECPL